VGNYSCNIIIPSILSHGMERQIYTLSDVINREMKKNELDRAHRYHMWKIKVHTQLLSQNVKGRDHSETSA
jgi:hypothetical protein